MTERYPNAFLLSATMHGAIVAVLLLFAYVLERPSQEKPKIFELVAGPGNNYMATEAPAVGTPGGVKLNVPAPTPPKPKAIEPEAAPDPEPVKPAAVKPQPAPVTPTPTTKATATTKAPPSAAKKILTQLANAENR